MPMNAAASRRPAARAAAFLALALAPVGGCRFRTPTVEVRGVEVAAIDFEGLEVVYDLAVTNPNETQLGLWAVTWRLRSGADAIARGSLPRPVTPLSAGQTAVVRLPVDIRYDAVAPLLGGPDRDWPLPCELVGEATFDYLGQKRSASFRRAGELPALRRPSWSFRDLRLAAPGEGVLLLTFEVTNPNGFALRLSRLTGTVLAGDEAVVRVDRAPLSAVPAGRTARLVAPVKLTPEAALRAAARAEAAPASLRFEGRLLMGPPRGLAGMLMGRMESP